MTADQHAIEKNVLSIKGVTKSFPGVQALNGVDFNLREGEIHALMGENGAGKSTLIKVITGVHRHDEGDITYQGKPLACSSPLQAQMLGISPVYQEINLSPNLSVAENVFLGRQPMKKFGGIDWKRLNAEATQVLARFDLRVNVERRLGSCSVAIQQMVAIARALELQSKVLILDEPTSSLNVEETERLFEQMRRLKESRHAIVFVTHFLDQAFDISDRITVLRNGNYIGTYGVNEIDKPALISKLLGRELENVAQVSRLREEVLNEEQRHNVLLETVDLHGKSGAGPYTARIRPGELVGCAGLLGSGRTEFANLLFGIDPADSGTVKVNGKTARIRSPRSAVKLGIGLSPEDRKTQGVVDDLSVRENIVLALQANKGWFRTIRPGQQRQIADKYIKLLNIKTPTAEQAIRNLSGGNQQKAIIARWLAASPELLILDEPTRGIDVGAKTEIQRLMVELSADGMAILFISSEVEEISRVSRKVFVMDKGSIVDTLYGNRINEEGIMHSIVARHVTDDQ